MDISANVHFLWNAASGFQSSGRTTELLKSLYLSRCIYVSQHKLKLPHKHFSPEVRCTHCKTTWENENYNIKIKRKKNNDKVTKRKLRKIIKNKHKMQTQFAIERAKCKMFNTDLDITCKLCKLVTQISTKKTTLVDYNLFTAPGSIKDTPRLVPNIEVCTGSVQKTEQRIESKSFTEFSAEIESTPTRTSVKKRKRDKFAGLSADACLSASKMKNKAPENLLMKFLRQNAS